MAEVVERPAAFSVRDFWLLRTGLILLSTRLPHRRSLADPRLALDHDQLRRASRAASIASETSASSTCRPTDTLRPWFNAPPVLDTREA